MGRHLNKEAVEEFINKNFVNKKSFVSEWNVSYSHFLKMLSGKGQVGNSSLKKLKYLANSKDVEIEDLLEPRPMIINDRNIKEIIVKDLEDNLIVSINSNNMIIDEDYVVEYIPYED